MSILNELELDNLPDLLRNSKWAGARSVLPSLMGLLYLCGLS